MTATDKPSEMIGRVFAERYRVVGHVGSGGMGDVFAVEHAVLGRQFALKRMNGQGSGHRVAIERFLREARAAASTGHPGVVEVFDLGFDGDGNPFLVMELLQGQSLRDRLRLGPLAPDDLRTLAEGMLEPLVAVHARGIVHRDLKPDNVYLLPHGQNSFRVKLLDFGLARTDDGGDQHLTHAGAVLGTPLYMAPEQARGGQVDARTDLYAVGAVLYEAATGKPPFRGSNYAVIIGQVLTQPPDPLPLGPLPALWRETILRALSKGAADRFADAAAMLATLRGQQFAVTEPYLAFAATVAQAPSAEFDATLDGSQPPVLNPAVAKGLPGEVPEVEALVQTGQIDAAQEKLGRAALRAKHDLDVQARAALLQVLGKRDKAYKAAAQLAGKPLSPWAQAVVAGLLAMRDGEPLRQVQEVAAMCQAWPDDAMLGYLHGRLLLEGDQFDQAKAIYLLLLDRWPAFEPAVDRLLEPLLLRDDIEAAEQIVETYIAHAPDNAQLDVLEVELWIGQQRYADALSRIERDIAANPAREKAFWQMLGDVRCLLGDVPGAIAAYDRIDKRERRDNYVFGALLQAGRVDEAKALLLGAMAQYQDGQDARVSRLGSLGLDAALLALEIGDAALAQTAADRLRDVQSAALEMRFASNRAFCQATAEHLAGQTPDLAAIGDESHPLRVLLAARVDPASAAAKLSAACAPAEMRRDGTVSMHAMPVLWADCGRALLQTGQPAQALPWLERVLRPRHFELTRGLVVRRALNDKAAALRALGRAGEAAAVERQLAQD